MHRHHVGYIPVAEGKAPDCDVKAQVMYRLEAYPKLTNVSEVVNRHCILRNQFGGQYSRLMHKEGHKSLAHTANDKQYYQEKDERVFGPLIHLDEHVCV